MATPEEEFSRELSRLVTRLDALETTVGGLQERLGALERRQGAPAAPGPLPPPPPAQVAPRPAPPTFQQPVPPAPAEPPMPEATAPPAASPPATVTPSAAAQPPPAPPRGPELPENWLTEVALKWAAPRVAGVALILAAIFALQWAIQNHRISPAAQVGLGVIAGLALLVLGDLNARRQRKILGEALLGSGSALLYVAIYAAYAAFRPPVLGYAPAFAGLAMVTAIAVLLAVRNEAQSTAILAVLGGFLTPKLLQGTGDGMAGMLDLVGLFVYVTILDLGLLAASLYHRWRPLQVLCFVATWVLVWTWLSNTSEPSLRYATSVPALALFAIFLLAPVLWNLRLRQPTEATDLGLILANPSCFCPTAASLVAIYHREWLGVLAVALGVVYLLLGEAARRRNPADRLLHCSWLSVGLTLVTIAIPLQFQAEWIVIAWGVEGALLVWVGLQARSYTVRALGLVLQTVVFGWLLLLYHLADPLPDGVLPFANTLFMSYLTGTLSIAVSLLLYVYGDLPAEERRQSVGALAVGLIALSVAGVSYELWRLGMPVHVHLVWWSVAAALTMVAGHAWRSYTVRVVGHLLNGAVVIWMAVLYSLRPEPVWLQTSAPVLNEVCLAYLVGLLSLAVTLLAYRRGEHLEPAERAVPGTIAPVLALLVVWDGASELSRLRMPSHVHLAWLALASGVLMATGHGRRSTSLRTTALVLQGILAVWLLFLYSLDAQPLWLRGHQPLLNETFLAFLLGLGSLGVTAALYGESGLKSADAVLVRRALPLVLAVLGLWGLTADVSRGLGELAREHLGLRSIRGFGVSLLWCIYAAGLVWYSLLRRRVEVRLIGVIVFGLAVLKVFLVDTWQLEAVWKALSYACLAGILLGVSYLYLLHREKLQALLTGDDEASPPPGPSTV